MMGLERYSPKRMYGRRKDCVRRTRRTDKEQDVKSLRGRRSEKMKKEKESKVKILMKEGEDGNKSGPWRVSRLLSLRRR